MRRTFFLFRADLLSIKYWFYSQTISKLLVLVGFVAVLLGTSWVLFVMAKAFFIPLVSYKEYGFLTGVYIIQASIVLLIWFGLVSAVSATSGFLVKGNKETSYLLTLPVKPAVLVFWIFLKTTFLNFCLLAIVFTPIGLAFGSVFFTGVSLDFLLRLFLVLLLLVILTNSLASIVAYKTASLIKRDSYLFSLVGIIIFIGMVIALIHFIFPPELEKLYEASSGEFSLLYGRLPLTSRFFPISWLTQILLYGVNFSTFYVIFLVFGVGVISIIFQKKRFISLFQEMASEPFKGIERIPLNLKGYFFKYPLVGREILGITRSPSELGYIGFLLSLALFFFLLLGVGARVRLMTSIWRDEFLIFSFAWLLFFTTAYGLRVVFPLMAKEGANAWYIFTLPLRKEKVLFAKIVLGLLASLPLVIVSFLSWYLLPLDLTNRSLFMALSMVMTLFLMMVNVFLGAIFPNFSQGSDSEKVSTSAMGLITLFVSGGATFLVGSLFYRVLKGAISPLPAFSLVVLGVLGLTVFLFLLAKSSLKRYEF